MVRDKEILTTKEVAEYLAIHPLTVHKYARQGKIPAFKIGTDWRFHKRYIEKWIQEKLEYHASVKELSQLAREEKAVSEKVRRGQDAR
jgi:PTS system nitrogen regulatory IIA component